MGLVNMYTCASIVNSQNLVPITDLIHIAFHPCNRSISVLTFSINLFNAKFSNCGPSVVFVSQLSYFYELVLLYTEPTQKYSNHTYDRHQVARNRNVDTPHYLQNSVLESCLSSHLCFSTP